MISSDAPVTASSHWVDYFVHPSDPVLRETIYCTTHPISDHAAVHHDSKNEKLMEGVETWKEAEKRMDRMKLLQYPAKKADGKVPRRPVRARVVLVRTGMQLDAHWEDVGPKYDPDLDGEYSPRWTFSQSK